MANTPAPAKAKTPKSTARMTAWHLPMWHIRQRCPFSASKRLWMPFWGCKKRGFDIACDLPHVIVRAADFVVDLIHGRGDDNLEKRQSLIYSARQQLIAPLLAQAVPKTEEASESSESRGSLLKQVRVWRVEACLGWFAFVVNFFLKPFSAIIFWLPVRFYKGRNNTLLSCHISRKGSQSQEICFGDHISKPNKKTMRCYSSKIVSAWSRDTVVQHRNQPLSAHSFQLMIAKYNPIYCTLVNDILY